MSYNYLPLDRKWLNFQQVKNLLDFKQQVSITFDAHERILKCREYLDSKPQNDDDKTEVEQLQHNQLLSDAWGLDEEVPLDIVKLMLMLKIKSLSYGHSGVDIETVKRLMEMYNQEVYPVIYTQGSPDSLLSQLNLPLIGTGEVSYKGEKRSAAEVLKELNWKPLTLKRHEVPALVTGTQFISAYGMYALKKCEQLLKFADLIAALSLDAFDCTNEAFHEKLHSISSHKGQGETAAVIVKYLKGSEIACQQKKRVETPNSFRCIPQVHGAAKEAFHYVLSVFLNEINSVSENPNIFPVEHLVLRGGNSFFQPLKLALEFLALSMTELADISERRTFELVNDETTQPLSIARNWGLLSGYQLAHETVAGIVHENKQLITPASLDGISSDNNKDDHASIGTNVAARCLLVIANVEKVLAIELLSAAQALELRRPLKTSPFLEQLLHNLHQHVNFENENRVFSDDLKKVADFVASYHL